MTARLTDDYRNDLLKRLKNSKFALGYLNECLKDPNEGVFLLALRDVAEAHGGFKKLAAKSKLNREHLFRILSRKGNPRLNTLRNLATAFGWNLALVAKHKVSQLRRAA